MKPKWTRAADVPRSWEGLRAWIYREWEPSDPTVSWVPTNFARNEAACKGVWFRLINTPAPPART